MTHLTPINAGIQVSSAFPGRTTPVPTDKRIVLRTLFRNKIGPIFDDSYRIARVQFSFAPETKMMLFLEQNGSFYYLQYRALDDDIFYEALHIWGWDYSGGSDSFRSELTMKLHGKDVQLSKSFGITITFLANGSVVLQLIGTTLQNAYIAISFD